MGLALCHIVPRDLLLRLVTVCLVVSFALTIAAVAVADEKGSLAAIDGGIDLSITGRAVIGSTLLCSKDLRAGACDDFVGAAQVTHALAITSLCVSALALALICFFVTPCAKTTTQMITALWFITFVPLAFLAATLGVGINLAVDKGNTNGSGFTVGKGMALIIAAMALAAVAVILTTIRTILSTCTRANDKDTVLRHKDINGVMQLHAVNDDWIRQKQVLAAHSFAVKVEIKEQAANEPTGDGDVAAPTNDDAEAAPPVFVHHRTASHAPPQA